MKNAGSDITKAFYSVLEGNITFKGATIPVYSNEGLGEPYIVYIAEQNGGSTDTRNSFYGDYRQLIEVMAEDKGFSAKKAAHNIANQVMELIQPTPSTNSLSSNDFQFLSLKMLSINNLEEDGANGSKIYRLLIRYQFKVNQLNV